mgnify:CR=1 FL=1
MEVLRLLSEIDSLSGKCGNLDGLIDDINKAEELVESINDAKHYVTDEDIKALKQLTKCTCTDCHMLCMVAIIRTTLINSRSKHTYKGME